MCLCLLRSCDPFSRDPSPRRSPPQCTSLPGTAARPQWECVGAGLCDSRPVPVLSFHPPLVCLCRAWCLLLCFRFRFRFRFPQRGCFSEHVPRSAKFNSLAVARPGPPTPAACPMTATLHCAAHAPGRDGAWEERASGLHLRVLPAKDRAEHPFPRRQRPSPRERDLTRWAWPCWQAMRGTSIACANSGHARCSCRGIVPTQYVLSLLLCDYTASLMLCRGRGFLEHHSERTYVMVCPRVGTRQWCVGEDFRGNGSASSAAVAGSWGRGEGCLFVRVDDGVCSHDADCLAVPTTRAS